MDLYESVRNEWTGIKMWEMSGLVLACGYNEWTGIKVCVMSGLVLKCA